LAELSRNAVRLSGLSKGDRGVVQGLDVSGHGGAIAEAELERRLLEMGFVEGAAVQVLHEGLFGRDPIAVKLDDMRVALRRREADAILLGASA
jgi:ferrous iron transport protein A